MLGNQSRRSFLKLAASGSAMFTPGLFTGSANAQGGPTLTVAWGTDIDSFDPAQFKSDGAYIVQANIYDTVLSWGAEPVAGSPNLAISKPAVFASGIGESWTYENDNKTLVVNIRRGLKFPSGRPVNANAVKYLFDRGLQSSGYMRLIFPTMIGVTEADQFEVRDDSTFAINLPAPSAMLLDVLSLSNNALLDPEEIKLHATADDPWASQWLKRNTAGLGPYKAVRNEPGVEVVLEATQGYWGASPYFKRIVIKSTANEADRILLLKRKAIDMVIGPNSMSPKNLKSLEGEPGLNVVSLPDTNCNFLCMNLKKKPFDNVKVRQAINYAMPIHAIIPNVLYGYGEQMKSPIAAQTPGHDGSLSPYNYDVAKAKSLMAEAGLGSEPIPVKLAVRVGYAPHEQAAIWIQRELEKIGFRVSIEKETDATFRQLSSSGGHELSIETWQSWINDPFYHLYWNFHSKASATNKGGYANPALDKIIDENIREADPARRMAAVKDAQKILLDDAAWGLLWYDNWARVTRSELAGVAKYWDSFERFNKMKLS
ncbi:ABC transporter substrate-binding protein [Bradyrhizobium sp. IC3195]|uniref:ABC transporter substrate-binding protein n=1 Tax=Bradyrhizobium sp. IC3195 TaxID=2793804 RepID=UPI001CD26179|nr:ABC transporter substrate-binding protein [Bradyrhizobium sp. IC3195]MCA1471122.1 ABC transporter substrate-binding protein [Bradyrhizobium sp. IC3195]